jgi:hypothetical protein
MSKDRSVSLSPGSVVRLERAMVRKLAKERRVFFWAVPDDDEVWNLLIRFHAARRLGIDPRQPIRRIKALADHMWETIFEEPRQSRREVKS